MPDELPDSEKKTPPMKYFVIRLRQGTGSRWIRKKHINNPRAGGYSWEYEFVSLAEAQYFPDRESAEYYQGIIKTRIDEDHPCCAGKYWIGVEDLTPPKRKVLQQVAK